MRKIALSVMLALVLLASSPGRAASPPPELAAVERALVEAKASQLCPPPDLAEAETGLQWARDAAAKRDQALARTLAVTARQLVEEAVAKAQAAATQERERVGKLFAKAYESAQQADRAGAGKHAARELEGAQKLLEAAQEAANTCRFQEAEDLVGQATKAFADAAKVAGEREAEQAKAAEVAKTEAERARREAEQAEAEAAAQAEAERLKAAEAERLKQEAERAQAERVKREAEQAKAAEAARAAAERVRRETKAEPPAPVTPPAGPQSPLAAPPQLKPPTLTLKTPDVAPPSPAAPPKPKELPPVTPPVRKPVPEKAPPEAKIPKGPGITLLSLEVIPSNDGAQVLLTLDGTLDPILHAPKPPSDIMTVDLPGVKQIQGPKEIDGYLPFIKSIRAVEEAARGDARLFIDLAHDIPVFVTVTMFDGDPENPRLVPTRIILTFLRETSRSK